MKRLLEFFARWIIARALRTPYTHLFNADGTPYMGRFWLFRTGLVSARVHRIYTRDHDLHLHDHPFSFVGLVLRGGYLESRPVTAEPCFSGDRERTEETFRLAGSWAYRRATDRHRIASVLPDTWTLIFMGPRVHWWGFFTPAGKVHWQQYPKCCPDQARTVVQP